MAFLFRLEYSKGRSKMFRKMRFPLCRTSAYFADFGVERGIGKGQIRLVAHGQDGSGFQPDAPDPPERTMKKHLIALSLAATALSAAPAFARDDGPRFRRTCSMRWWRSMQPRARASPDTPRRLLLPAPRRLRRPPPRACTAAGRRFLIRGVLIRKTASARRSASALRCRRCPADWLTAPRRPVLLVVIPSRQR